MEPPVAQVVGRVLGEERHDAAQGIAPVERGVGAAHDLDRLQNVDIESHLVDVEGPEVELLRRLDAVHLRHHPVSADTADVEAVETEPGHAVCDIDARFVLDEVGEILDEAILDGLAVDDRDHARGLPDRRRPQGRRDGHGIQESRRIIDGRCGAVFWIGLRLRGGCLVVGGLLREDRNRPGQKQDQRRGRERPRCGETCEE